MKRAIKTIIFTRNWRRTGETMLQPTPTSPTWHFRFLFSSVSSWIPLPRLLPRLTEKISGKIKYCSSIAWNFWSHRKTVTIVNHSVSLYIYIYIYLLHRDNKTTIDKWKLINIVSILFLFFLNINNFFDGSKLSQVYNEIFPYASK